MDKVTALSSPTTSPSTRLCDYLGRALRHRHAAIVYFGTEEQKRKYLPRLGAGEIVGAYALSESTSGSDAMNCRAAPNFRKMASTTS